VVAVWVKASLTMSTYASRCQLAACFALVAASATIRAQTPDANWNLAVIDRILAGVKPGQQLAQVGDMQILVYNLRAWRNRLAGGPLPESTFDGTAPSWTGGVVYYTFDASVSAPNQKAFLDGANEWATFANFAVCAKDDAGQLRDHPTERRSGRRTVGGGDGGRATIPADWADRVEPANDLP